jgi:hypothetical protein
MWTLFVDAVDRMGEIILISPPRCPGKEAKSPESTGTSSTVYYGSPRLEMQYSKPASALLRAIKRAYWQATAITKARRKHTA